MKKLFYTGLILLVIALGAYSFFWKNQAQNAKVRVEKQLQEWNKDSKGDYQISYDAITVHGFPLDVEVWIENPKVEVLNPFQTEKRDTFKSRMKGHAILGKKIFSNEGWVGSKGETYFNFIRAGGDQSNHLEVVSKGDMMLHVSSPAFNPFHQIHQQGRYEELGFKEWWSLLKGSNLIFKDLSIGRSDAETNRWMELKKAAFILTKENAERDWMAFNFVAMLEGLDFPDGEGFAKLMDNSESESLASFLGSVIHRVDLKNSIASANFEFEVILPDELEQILSEGDFSKLKGSKINLKKLDIDTKFTKGMAAASVEIKEKDKNALDVFVKMDQTSTVFPVYYDTFMSVLDQYREEFKGKEFKNPNMIMVKDLLVNHLPDVKNMIPKWHNFGNIALKLNMENQVENIEGFWMVSALDIKTFEMTSLPFGYKFNGISKLAEGQFSTHSAMTLEKYQAMVTKAAGFYNRVRTVMNLVLKEWNNDPLPEFTLKKQEAVLALIKKISDHPEVKEKDVTITVDFPDMPHLKVGTLTVPQLMEAWQTFMYQWIQEDQAELKE